MRSPGRERGPCPPCCPCQAIGSLGSAMVIYGLARGGHAPWHPVRLSWQLARPRLAPPAAIFKAPGLHPKYSEFYFWCKMIFLGGGRGVFFWMKLMGLEAGRERETAGHSWRRGRRRRKGSWWPWRSGPRQSFAPQCSSPWFAHGSGITKPGLGLQLGFVEDAGGLCICLKWAAGQV